MSRAESLSDILSKIEDHNKPIPYAPSPRVEEEIQEVVDTIAIQETIADSSSTSIVEDHFIKEGENIARAMEAKAAIYEKTAEEYRQIARDTRAAAATQATAASNHEKRMGKIKDLLLNDPGEINEAG